MNTSFEKSKGNDEWLTPKNITDELGPFDLDPCSPIIRPWDVSTTHYNKLDDGLSKDWNKDFVWMNPPYGRETFKWMSKLATHNNGIALIFARTDTVGFHAEIFNKADVLLFIKGRLRFHYVDGRQGDSAGAPSCLVAFGEEAVNRLSNCNIKGKLVFLK